MPSNILKNKPLHTDIEIPGSTSERFRKWGFFFFVPKNALSSKVEASQAPK